jgi:hypothetical protein
MSKARYVVYIQAIPDGVKENPKIHQTFFCRSKEAITEVINFLETFEESVGRSGGNTRRARALAVVGIDQDAVERLPEENRPCLVSGDVFPSVHATAKALNVSRAYIHQELRKASESPSEDFAYPVARVRGALLAYVDDIPD